MARSRQEQATYHTYHGSQREAGQNKAAAQQVAQSAEADAERAQECSEQAAVVSSNAGKELLRIDQLLQELGGTALAA